MLFASHTFLEDLGLVLCVAAVTTVLFQSIRQPVVVGYLIAGMVVGPNVTFIPLLADTARIHALSELGVILLMFALGLEFSISKLLRLGPTAGFVTALQVGLMVWLGYIVGRELGWTSLESIFTGVALSISSTTIVAKAYGEQGNISKSLSDLVFGVLLAEDLTAVMLLAVLTALASGAGLTAQMMAWTVGRLALFLVVLVCGGLLIVPRAIRMVVRLGRSETTLVASIGVCFAFAIIAEHAGYSVALGAFLAGSMVAESGESESIEHLVAPVRDIFGAVFFVSVGMMIEPAMVAEHWLAMTLLVIVVIVGKLFGVTIASMLSGVDVQTSVQAGMSLTQIGEFSFIIAGLGLSTHATRDFLYTLAIAVSAVTTFTTPFMIRASAPLGEFVASRMPTSIGTMQLLYDSLMYRIRRRAVPAVMILRPIIMIGVSCVAIAAIMIGNDIDYVGLTHYIVEVLGIDFFESELLVDIAAVVACVPFMVLMYFGARDLAQTLVLKTLSTAHSRDETGALTGPAEALSSILQATLLLVVVAPLLALIQPFLEPLEGLGAMIIGVSLMGIVIWRSAGKMRGQMHALMETLAESLTKTRAASHSSGEIPGLGMITPVRLEAGASAIGRTLSSIDLRNATGAAAIAIARGDDGVIVPTGAEVLQEGDVVGLAGTAENVDAARQLLAERTAIAIS
ncbi:MAG: cation:proton antiporter [Candidatus Binataceae bacterium]